MFPGHFKEPFAMEPLGCVSTAVCYTQVTRSFFISEVLQKLQVKTNQKTNKSDNKSYAKQASVR